MSAPAPQKPRRRTSRLTSNRADRATDTRLFVGGHPCCVNFGRPRMRGAHETAVGCRAGDNHEDKDRARCCSARWRGGGAHGCGDDKPAARPVDTAEGALAPFELESELPPAVREAVLKPFTGDLDGSSSDGSYGSACRNRTFYFVDKGVPRGIAYEIAASSCRHASTSVSDARQPRIHVILLPLPRGCCLRRSSTAR